MTAATSRALRTTVCGNRVTEHYANGSVNITEDDGDTIVVGRCSDVSLQFPDMTSASSDLGTSAAQDYRPHAIIGENDVGHYLFWRDTDAANGSGEAQWGPSSIASADLVAQWTEYKGEALEAVRQHGDQAPYDMFQDGHKLIISLRRPNPTTIGTDMLSKTNSESETDVTNDATSHVDATVATSTDHRSPTTREIIDLTMDDDHEPETDSGDRMDATQRMDVGFTDEPSDLATTQPLSEDVSDDLVMEDADEDPPQIYQGSNQVSAVQSRQFLSASANEATAGNTSTVAVDEDSESSAAELLCNDNLLDEDVDDHSSPYVCEDANHKGPHNVSCKQHHQVAVATLNSSQQQAFRDAAGYPLCDKRCADLYLSTPILSTPCTCLTKRQCTWCFWDEIDAIVKKRQPLDDLSYGDHCVGCGTGNVTGNERLLRCFICDGIRRRV